MFKNITNQIVNEVTQQLIAACLPVITEEIQKVANNLSPLIEAELNKANQELINELQNLGPLVDKEVDLLIKAITPIIVNEINTVGQEILAQLKANQK